MKWGATIAHAILLAGFGYSCYTLGKMDSEPQPPTVKVEREYIDSSDERPIQQA